MFLFNKPTQLEVQSYLSECEKLPLSYSENCMTKETDKSFKGYKFDCHRIKLGKGQRVYKAAIKALQAWQQFNLGWVEIANNGAPIKPGTTAIIVVSMKLFWVMCACKIVYLLEDQHKFGFAYGTLEGHPESGEELFLVEFNPEDESVWYEIRAFSKPGLILVSLVYPFTRGMQKKFARESCKIMQIKCDTI